jgi:cell division transport system permease protein
MPYYIHASKKTKTKLHLIPAMISGFNQLWLQPFTNLLIISVITFALFLPTGFYVGWKNVKALNNDLNQSAEISLYLKKDVDQKIATNLAEQLKLNMAIMELKLISPDEGMKNFSNRVGFGEILAGFKENPLPYVISIYPKLNELTQDQIDALIVALKALPEVEATKINMDWIAQSYHLLKFGKCLSLLLAWLLGVGALIVICGIAYITPQIITNKTDTTKRILQYQCFWHSLLGGLLAIALINFILMRLHNFGFVFQSLGGSCSIALILTGILLSAISSKLAMRHLPKQH